MLRQQRRDGSRLADAARAGRVAGNAGYWFSSCVSGQVPLPVGTVGAGPDLDLGTGRRPFPWLTGNPTLHGRNLLFDLYFCYGTQH
jgi:hypothetical protein